MEQRDDLPAISNPPSDISLSIIILLLFLIGIGVLKKRLVENQVNFEWLLIENVCLALALLTTVDPLFVQHIIYNYCYYVSNYWSKFIGNFNC